MVLRSSFCHQQAACASNGGVLSRKPFDYAFSPTNTQIIPELRLQEDLGPAPENPVDCSLMSWSKSGVSMAWKSESYKNDTEQRVHS